MWARYRTRCREKNKISLLAISTWSLGTHNFWTRIDVRTKISLWNKHLDCLFRRLFFVLSAILNKKLCVPRLQKLFVLVKWTVGILVSLARGLHASVWKKCKGVYYRRLSFRRRVLKTARPVKVGWFWLENHPVSSRGRFSWAGFGENTGILGTFENHPPKDSLL
jgi:hypothetical protein